eukprot:1139077-Pelagomonas_calceolata.AAC.18
MDMGMQAVGLHVQLTLPQRHARLQDTRISNLRYAMPAPRLVSGSPHAMHASRPNLFCSQDGTRFASCPMRTPRLTLTLLYAIHAPRLTSSLLYAMHSPWPTSALLPGWNPICLTPRLLPG